MLDGGQLSRCGLLLHWLLRLDRLLLHWLLRLNRLLLLRLLRLNRLLLLRLLRLNRLHRLRGCLALDGLLRLLIGHF